jgi:hypothetical protein
VKVALLGIDTSSRNQITNVFLIQLRMGGDLVGGPTKVKKQSGTI